MMHVIFGRLAAIGLIFLTVQSLSGQENTGEKPNILLIMTDDHRWDVLGCAGHPTVQTPNIDQLAEKGVRFTNAFVTTSICAASRASYLTGLYERTHKYTFGTPPLASELCRESYPTRLRKAGYQTGFVGKFGVNVGEQGRNEMFDWFKPVNRSPYFKKQADGTSRHTSQLIGDHAIEFLEQQTDEPFCLSVSFNASHAEDSDRVTPFPWPKVVDGMYDDADVPRSTLDEPGVFEQHPGFLKQSLNRQRWYWRWDSPERYEFNVKAYWRMISGVDHVVGRLLEQLEKQGDADNTIIIFCGDNGFYLGSRGFAGKWSHYDESLRIPLIVYDPRTKPTQSVDDSIVLNIDVPATIVDYAGFQPPATWQVGQSLRHFVDDDVTFHGDWRSSFFCEHLMHYPGGIPKWEGVRNDRWMYASYIEEDPPYEFLHDLQEDPNQLTNLAADTASQSQLKKMREETSRFRESLGGEYNRETFPTRRGDPSHKRPEQKPNVVLIISDDHNWNDYSTLGHLLVKTPNIDRLANQSAFFPRGYVTSSLCRPSLASMMTGLYPHQHKVTGNDCAIPPGLSGNPRADEAYLELCSSLISDFAEAPNIAGLLGESGYRSLQTGKWWEGNFSQGGFTEGMTHGDPKRGGRHGDVGLKIGREGLQPVFDFIEAKPDQPFFVWYAPFLPHTPHNPPEDLLAKYRDKVDSIELAKYYAMVDWFDQTCGELLKYLDEKKLARNTVVIYLADNGWVQRTPQSELPENWNKAFAPRSKQSPYENGVRTPIMIRWPGVIQPSIRHEAISSIDFLPTILSAAGLEIPEGLPGQDLLAVLSGEDDVRPAVFGEIYAHDIPSGAVADSLLYRYCIEGRWKLIRTYPGKTGRYASLHPQTDQEIELYDLYADPHESKNVASANPEVVERLSQLLQQWWRVPDHD